VGEVCTSPFFLSTFLGRPYQQNFFYEHDVLRSILVRCRFRRFLFLILGVLLFYELIISFNTS
jgi:hypothetical protein